MISYEPLFQTMKEKRSVLMSLINVVFHVLLIMRSNMGKGSLRTPLTNSVPSSIAAYPMWLNILKRNRSCLKNAG